MKESIRTCALRRTPLAPRRNPLHLDKLWLMTILLAAASSAASADMIRQTADVFGQGVDAPTQIYFDAASLVRSDNKLVISVRIPTPEPETYNYPGANPFNPAAVPGHPEAFSLWAFVFNDPDSCIGPSPGDFKCNIDDFRQGRGDSAAYNVAGHLVSGPVLQLNGSVTLLSETFGGTGVPLYAPMDAEVHLAIAPHGGIQPEAMPNQIKTPIGNEHLHWWLAGFMPE